MREKARLFAVFKRKARQFELYLLLVSLKLVVRAVSVRAVSNKTTKRLWDYSTMNNGRMPHKYLANTLGIQRHTITNCIEHLEKWPRATSTPGDGVSATVALKAPAVAAEDFSEQAPRNKGSSSMLAWVPAFHHRCSHGCPTPTRTATATAVSVR